MRLVLASASATRARVLRGAGVAFEQHASSIEEDGIKREARAAGQSPEAAASALAHAKAAHVAVTMPDVLVIGADQILACGDAWFDKPPDLAAARAQLQTLRGQVHGLATAVVCHAGGKAVWQHVETPRLAMREFSDVFLDRYLAAEGAAVLSSVGAYRLEGMGAQLFARIEGDYFSVLGLPLLPLLGFLRDRGVMGD
jgi:septum formation protein